MFQLLNFPTLLKVANFLLPKGRKKFVVKKKGWETSVSYPRISWSWVRSSSVVAQLVTKRQMVCPSS